MGPPRRPGFYAANDASFRGGSRHGLSRSLVRAGASMLVGLPWLLATSSAAQGPADGAVHGFVSDSHGEAVPSAIVTLLRVDTGFEQTTAATNDGSYVRPHLAPGSYRIAIGAPGFATQRYAPVEVMLGETLELQTTLRVLGVSESIEVRDRNGGLPGLEASLSARALEQFPSNGRRWQDFALTTPGVLPDENGDGLISVHGLPATQNSVLVDGGDTNQSFNSVPVGTGDEPAINQDDSDAADQTNGPAHGLGRGRHSGAAYTFSQSAVREFRVSSQGYSAQTGRAGGGIITTLSRSGTQQFHGSAFFVLRSQAFAAKNALSVATTYNSGVITSATVKPHDLRENFGATLGGPVPRVPGLFFFYAFDEQRRGFPAISSPADPNFYNLTVTQRALLGTRGVSRAATDASLNYLSSLTGTTNRRADQTIHFGKLDWQARPRLGLGLQYNRVRWNSPAGLIDAPVVARARASLGNAAGSVDTVLFRATSTLSAQFVNQVRLQYMHDVQYETPQANLPQEPGIGPAGQAPEVNIGPNGLLFGTPATLARSAFPDERRIELADTVTLVRGHHLIEFGGDLSLVHDRVATLANAAGTFRYDSGNTRGFAGGLVDFITDQTFNVNVNPNGACPSISAANHFFCFRSYTQSFGENSVAFSTQEWAGFIEDTWRPLASLNIKAGLRYEYTLLPLPVKPNPALDAIFSKRGATGIFPEDRNNFGPRVSLAYEPFGEGRGTLRVGYGLFYGRLAGATIRAALSDTAQPLSTSRIRITPTAVVDCPQVANQGFGYPCSFSAQPAGVAAVSASAAAVVFDRRFRLPVVQQGSISLERSISHRLTLSATYIFNLDEQLPGTTDLNIAPATRTARFRIHGGAGAPGVRDGQSFVLPFYTTRITSAFGPVTEIASRANATYHGLVLQADSRASETLTFGAHFTWSKAIDYAPALSATPRTNSQLDPFADGYDKGLSSLNYPYALYASAVWTPLVHFEREAIERFARGWEVAPIVAVHSGRPYSYDLFGGPRLPGGHASLNGSGGALYLPTIGRNTLHLPLHVTTDLRLARAFDVGSRWKLRASAEAFNLFNYQNVSSVNQRAFLVGRAVAGETPLTFQDAATIASEGLNTQPFGTPTSIGTSLARERQIQLGLQLNF